MLNHQFLFELLDEKITSCKLQNETTSLKPLQALILKAIQSIIKITDMITSICNLLF